MFSSGFKGWNKVLALPGRSRNMSQMLILISFTLYGFDILGQSANILWKYLTTDGHAKLFACDIVEQFDVGLFVDRPNDAGAESPVLYQSR